MNFDIQIDRFSSPSIKWNKYPNDVLPMWIADMDFQSPREVTLALRKTVEHGVYGYATVPNELNEIAVKRMEKKHNWAIKPEWIVWLPGMVPALHLSTRLFNNVGIMTFTPVYKPFHEAPLLANNTLQAIPFVLENNSWQLDRELMEQSVTPETKLLMLCNPHNPVGKVFSKEELDFIADFCKKHSLILISDEIHCDLLINPTKKHLSIAAEHEYIAQNSISLFAPSKTFNIAGLGLTFAIIPNPELRSKFEALKYGVVPSVTGFSIDAALAAYKYGEPWRLKLIAYLQDNYDYLYHQINAIDQLSMPPMDATYLAWINYEKTDDPNFVQTLEKAGLGVMDASIFKGEKHFRLNFGTQKANIIKAIDIIKSVLNK